MMETARKRTLTRKLIHAGGWQLVKRTAKMVPFGGGLLALALVGNDIKRKGPVFGILNAGIDAVPFVGLAKNAVEIFSGDLLPDLDKTKKRK